jgi:hypothetical protein
VCQALQSHGSVDSVAFVKARTGRKLPSNVHKKKSGGYSLFRIDIVEEDANAQDVSKVTDIVRVDSPCLEGLDPKDFLYRIMEELGVHTHAPIIPTPLRQILTFNPFQLIQQY